MLQAASRNDDLAWLIISLAIAVVLLVAVLRGNKETMRACLPPAVLDRSRLGFALRAF
jgi:hypothetical protein